MSDTVRIPYPMRLMEAVRKWFEYTKPMREIRFKMLQLYANGYYSGADMKSRSPLPINLIDRGVQTLGPFLVAHNPRVKVTPRKGISSPYVKPFANTLELALAHLFSEIKLADYTLRPCAIDSLFGMGITKTGIMHSHNVEINGYLHDVGQPYCDKIDFNDYIADVAARNRQEMKFEGHKYRLPLWYVKDSGLFTNYDQVKTDIEMYTRDTSPEKIAKDGDNFQFNELHPTVELMDIWLPDEEIIITLPTEGGGTKIMRTVEYEGPEGGPFDVLGYRYFPDSVIPIPPVYTWLDLNKIINTITMKMKDMCEREKTIGLYPLESADDAEVIKRTGHGELAGVIDPNAINEITFGGFNARSFPFLQFLLSQYSQSGPNLDTVGGRNLGAPTLGQEQMLQTNALREVDDMVGQMYEFTASISKKLAWYMWSDPLMFIPVIKRVAGVEIQEHYSEASREGDFFDYAFDIEPFSMARMNPEMRYQRLLQLISQIVMPLIPIAQTQGSSLDVTALLNEAAPYLGINNVNDWWRSLVPQDQNLGPYQPVQGEVTGGKERPNMKVKSGQGRDQFGSSEASRLSNKSQMGVREGK